MTKEQQDKLDTAICMLVDVRDELFVAQENLDDKEHSGRDQRDAGRIDAAVAGLEKVVR
jgi:hypothetical protein